MLKLKIFDLPSCFKLFILTGFFKISQRSAHFGSSLFKYEELINHLTDFIIFIVATTL